MGQFAGRQDNKESHSLPSPFLTLIQPHRPLTHQAHPASGAMHFSAWPGMLSLSQPMSIPPAFSPPPWLCLNVTFSLMMSFTHCEMQVVHLALLFPFSALLFCMTFYLFVIYLLPLHVSSMKTGIFVCFVYNHNFSAWNKARHCLENIF